MKFKDLYEKGLDRKVNPAVSASDFTDETVFLIGLDSGNRTSEVVLLGNTVADNHDIVKSLRLVLQLHQKVGLCLDLHRLISNV